MKKVLLGIVACTMLLASCKKEENKDIVKARVKSYTVKPEGTTYNITYNELGNVASFAEIIYQWEQGDVTSSRTSYNRKDSYVRNAAGYVIMGESVEWGYAIAFSYINNSQLSEVRQTEEYYYNDTGYTTKNYTWADGNIISSTHLYESSTTNKNTTYEYEYYTDKTEMRDFGMNYFPYLMSGGYVFGYFLSKNLLKKVTVGGYSQKVYEYTYDFDNKGRVSRVYVYLFEQSQASRQYAVDFEYFD